MNVEWRQQGRYGNRLGYGFFALVLRWLGRRPAYLILRVVAVYYLLFRPSSRRAAYPYLRRRFPERGGWRRWLDAYRLMVALGQTLIDRGAVGILGQDCLTVDFPQAAELKALADERRGVILLTSHVGNWQVAMSALGYLQAPVTLLMTRDDARYAKHYYELAGQPCPFNIVDPGGFLGGTIELTAALRRGECVSVMGDRLLGQGSVEVEFLGGKARFPNSAYALALTTGATLVALASTKTGYARYAIELLMVERTGSVARGRREAEMARWAGRYAAALADYTRRHPYQWFNFFNVWEGEEGREKSQTAS